MHGLTWKQWVFYAEHGWPVSVGHGFHDLFLCHVCSSILDADPRFQVVKMAAIQLKELNQQDTQVLVGIPGINTRMELKGRERETELLCI